MTKAGFHTITVSEETYQDLEAIRKTNGCRSISQAVRGLVRKELGLVVKT